MESKQIVVDGILLRYLKEFPTRRPRALCLFLHGWRSDAQCFVPIMHEMALDNIASLSLDLPGFGRSQLPVRPFTLSDYAHCVKACMRKLGVNIDCLIGHSFGGRIAIKILSSNNQFSNKLILIDSAGIIEHPKRVRILKLIANLVKPVFFPNIMKPLKIRIYQSLGADDYLETRDLKDTYLSIIAENLQQDLPWIKAKTLIIWGENDIVTPLSIGRSMHQYIPYSRLEVLPHAGHFSFLDQPKLTKHLIKKFLKF